MVMFVEKYAELEIIGVRDEDLILVLEETFRVSGPVRVRQIYEVVRDWVG